MILRPWAVLLLFVGAATFLGGFVFPWWWPAVPGLLAGFWKPGTPVRNFMVAFAGAGLAWAAVAQFFDWRNAGILSARIAPLLHLPGGLGLILATAGLGGVTAGLGALLGNHFRLFWRSLSEALAAQDVLIPPDEEERAGRRGTEEGG